MATRLTTILVAVIVSATFIAGLIVGAQRDDASGPVDLIIVNGRVYPGAGADLQEALAVRGNQILLVGSNRDIKRLRRPQTVVLDAHGAAVLPGLNDAHVQLMAGALTLDHLDLTPARTLDDLEAELRHYAEEKPAEPWLLARNGDTDLVTADGPARRILDEAIDDRPVLITSEDGNIAWANSRALDLAGIDRKTPNPESGIVVRDRQTGEPTGVLTDDAVALVTRSVPPPTRAEKLAALRNAIAEAHRLGVTSVQTVSDSEEELRLLQELRQEGDLTLRVSASIAVEPTIGEPELAALDRLRAEFPDDPTLKVGSAVVVCPCLPEQLERTIALLDRHLWPVMVQTTSDADADAAVDAFETIADADPPARGTRRHRLDDNVLSAGTSRAIFGSNWPAAPLDPLDAIDEAADAPAELRSGIDAYTAHAAFASFDEQRKGTLTRGMLADIIILSNDIFDPDAVDPLRDSVVMVTIVDGKVVYQRPAASSND